MNDNEVSLQLPCFMCGRQLEPVFGPGDRPESDGLWKQPYNQPYKGTVFNSHGHYGSTVFDTAPYSKNSIEITICDSCLEQNASRVLYVRPVNPDVRYKVVPWNPGLKS